MKDGAGESVDAVVIGGGIFGCVAALELRRRGADAVILLERAPDLLARASSFNQARVHGGYHYPESFLTALRSRVNAPRFREEYRDCIIDSGVALYAIPRASTSTTGRQFRMFCERIGAPLRNAAARWTDLFSRDLIDAVFEVEECLFDAGRLRERLRRDLALAGVRTEFDAEARHIARGVGGGLQVCWSRGGSDSAVRAKSVLNCTYSGLNRLLAASGIAPLPLQLQVAEIARVEAPEALASVGITVVSGPFFSILPEPGTGGHLLSHVRYTPQERWDEGDGTPLDGSDRFRPGIQRVSRYPFMVQDASRYVPSLKTCRYTGSFWEIKAFLPRSAGDQSRPILVHRSSELPGLINILGAKIDNIFDMIESLDPGNAEAPPP